MTYRFDTYNYTVRFNKGELLVQELTNFIKDQNIRGGWIVGLGGLTWAELGFYNLSDKQYKWTKFDELLELSNLTGNISWNDNQPALHLHASVAGEDLQAKAGHLKEAKVAGTVEIFIHRWLDDEGLIRNKDEHTGLNLLDL